VECSGRISVLPGLRVRFALRFQARRQIGKERVRLGFGKAPSDGDGLLAGRQRLLQAAKVGQAWP